MKHSGDCEIHFHVSGQSFDKVESVEIVPNDIKSMAGWVIGHCASSGKGGMVTKGLKKTIDAMNDASSKVFPDPPLRKWSSSRHHGCAADLRISPKQQLL